MTLRADDWKDRVSAAIPCDEDLLFCDEPPDHDCKGKLARRRVLRLVGERDAKWRRLVRLLLVVRKRDGSPLARKIDDDAEVGALWQELGLEYGTAQEHLLDCIAATARIADAMRDR